MRRFFPGGSRTPLYLALVLFVPLYLTALQAASLAIDRPQTFKLKKQVVVDESTTGIPDASGNTGAGKEIKVDRWPNGQVELRTSNTTEQRIWLWALLPVGLLVLAGIALQWIRHGAYLACAAASVLAVACTWRLDRWEANHTARYPLGFDLVPKSSSGDRLDPGEWETSAREASSELRTFVIALAVFLAFCMLASAFLQRRRAPLDTPLPGDLASSHLGDAPGTGGAL